MASHHHFIAYHRDVSNDAIGLWTVWYTPNAYAEGIFSLTRNQVGSRVFTPMVVHAVHRSLLGYFSRANSASFCTALVLSAIGSLAIFCSFFRHAVSVARFWLKSAWLWK